MAAKYSSKGRQRGRRRIGIEPRSGDLPTPPVAGNDRTARISAALREAIDAERRNLQKVDSVLGCLIVALEYGYDGEDIEEPDYSDVARALRQMLATSLARLDSINLHGAGKLTGRYSG